MERCEQIKCGFYLAGGCQSCDDCKAKPYHINENCDRCVACENVENSLRWGEKTDKKEEVLIMQKVM